MKVLGKTLLAVWTIVEVDLHENGMLVATINALDEDFVCRHKLWRPRFRDTRVYTIDEHRR